MSSMEAPATLHWSGQAVDVQAIDAALERLREKATAVAPVEGSALGTRTSIITLVAYAIDATTAQQAADTIAKLPEYHPSRSIIVLAEPSDGEPAIDAQLSAHCHIAPGLEGQVCFEEVALTVKGRAARHLHSVLLPLLVPDLPVFFWWLSDLPDDPHLLDDVLDASDRFIVDSTRFSEAERTLPRLARLAQERAAAFSDLSWARLSPWRQLIAQFFDAPSLRPYLDSLSAVNIKYAAGNAAQALLLAGWLAARLGWQAEAKENHTYRLRSASGAILMSLDAEPSPDEEPGSLLSARLAAFRSGQEATFHIQPTPELHLVTVRTEAPEVSLERTARLAGRSEPEVLSQELEIAGRDRLYEETLATAVTLLNA